MKNINSSVTLAEDRECGRGTEHAATKKFSILLHFQIWNQSIAIPKYVAKNMSTFQMDFCELLPA